MSNRRSLHSDFRYTVIVNCHKMKKISQREILEKKHKNFTPTQRYNAFLKEHEKFANQLKEMAEWFNANKQYLPADQVKKLKWGLKYRKGLLVSESRLIEHWKKLLPKFEMESKKRKES